ncbi:MAG: hypothetical protein LJE83_11305 [Gammaproteobacteria bacterium]|jgi:hypothetical protein|nr:hypothetical protein [Gammaproteobacteria bacterium]
MKHKQNDRNENQQERIFSELALWVLHYKPNKISQPWSILDTFDNRLSAIIKANQVSSKYFMVKVTSPDGKIAWSN